MNLLKVLDNTKFSAKLMGSYISLACIAGIIGWIGIRYMDEMNEGSDKLYEQMVVPISDMQDVSAAFQKVRNASRDIIRANDPEAIRKQQQSIVELSGVISSAMERFESHILSQEMRDMYSEFVENRKDYLAQLERIEALAIENKDAEAWLLIDGDGKVAADAEGASIDLLTRTKVKHASQLAAANTGSAHTASSIMILTIGLGVVISVAIGIILTRSIVKPLERGVKMMENMADGDITTRLSMDRKDEIGVLARAMDGLASSLASIMEELKSNSEILAASADEMSATSSQISSNAEEMSSQANSVASSSEQASVNINNMSAAADGMSVSVRSVASSIEEMSASINEVAKQCQNELRIVNAANAKAEATETIMERLGTSANEIGRIVDVIKTIASQTNLLALNATIESASAGEAGKGFAVVANEVKELARQTSSATEEIAKQIEGIQENATQAVKAIEEIVEVINEINGISQTIVSAVDQQAATVSEISISVSGSSDSANEIARNVQETASGLTQISSNIQGVSYASSDTAQGIIQVKENSVELSRLAVALETVVGRFKI